MSDLDRIYQKYISIFYEVDGGGTWIDLSAVRYALRAALREMAQPAPNPDRQGGAIKRLNDWLAEHAPDEYHQPGDTADAMIMAADRLRGMVVRLSLELAAAIDERDHAEQTIMDVETWLALQSPKHWKELRDARATLTQAVAQAFSDVITSQAAELDALRSQLAQMDADNARLTQELTTVRSWSLAPTGNGKSAPALDCGTAIQNPPVVLSPSAQIAACDLSENASDYQDGLDAGRWTWRHLPKSIRLELVRHTISRLPTRTQADFDAQRPEWMPTATTHVHTFGVSWSHLTNLAKEIEVAP
jgi:hypothetical protein